MSPAPERREGPALGLVALTGREGAAREGVLHHRETDEHDDQHQPADQRRRHEVGEKLPVTVKRRGRHPGDQQEPGRHQHDGAIVAMGREMQHEDEADARHRRDGNPRHARRDRRIDDREPHERSEKHEPERRHVAVAHMPAIEVEIGEQEHQQGRGEHRLGARAIDLLGLLGDGEDALEEPEIDARIGEHRPGEGGGGGEDQRALHHEHDGEEQRQKTRDADDDALVERQAVDPVLVGIGVPELQLRQFGGAKLGHERHGCAGIEGDQEDIRVRAVVALRPDALARRDGLDAGGPEIGPDHAGAGEAEMRRHEEAVDLLVGIVGQREDDPVGAGAGFAGLHGDPADDAVAPGRRGDADLVAVRPVALDHGREVDGLGVGIHAHGFDSLSDAGQGEPHQGRRQTR